MASIFASIGLSGLIPALSLRRNSKEYVPVTRLDESASGCFSCPNRKSGGEACASCPSRIYFTETKTVYRNEKARYGRKPPLRKNALALYMHLHFLNPDANGYVSSIDEEEAASALGCSKRTVENNMRLLQKNGYVSFGKTSVPDRLQAFITDYKTAFLKADEGGRGYLRISRELFERLVALPDVNSMRLAVRTYFEESEEERRFGKETEKSLNEIKSRLPKYVTKKRLLEILESDGFAEVFEVLKGSRSASLFVRKRFDQMRIAESLKAECLAEVRKFAAAVNRKAGKKTPKLSLTPSETSDVCGTALKIPIPSVLEGLKRFYETYVKQGIPYGSAGALVRMFASAHAEYGFIP